MLFAGTNEDRTTSRKALFLGCYTAIGKFSTCSRKRHWPKPKNICAMFENVFEKILIQFNSVTLC